MQDQILLEGVQVMAYVGITSDERSQPQMLEIDAKLDCNLQTAAQMDRLGLAVDYASVHQAMIATVQLRPRALIETVAEEIAKRILGDFPIKRAEITVRKFVLPNTRSVAVKVIRPPRANPT